MWFHARQSGRSTWQMTFWPAMERMPALDLQWKPVGD
jgi:hypothetical protein